MCIGFYEVQKKLDMLKELYNHPNRFKDYKRLNRAPVIKGPNNGLYIIDHHHLSSALLLCKETEMYVHIIKDYSLSTMKEFEEKLIKHEYCYLKDKNGKKTTFSMLPSSITELEDDPYRSLAGIVRDKHGFRKTAIPYVEFQWADFFRSYEIIGHSNQITKEAVARAVLLSQSEKAKSLPGWKGCI